jgi:uncharacterized protein (DUF111 family)
MLETNIDNMNPEIYSYLFPKLLANKALDVFVTAVTMKKNRPANILSVLCEEVDVEKIEEIIFTETTTLGIRKYKVERSELERKLEKIDTKFGEITLKIAFLNGKLIKSAPEYEDCQKIASANNLPMIQVYNEAIAEASKKFKL